MNAVKSSQPKIAAAQPHILSGEAEAPEREATEAVLVDRALVSAAEPPKPPLRQGAVLKLQRWLGNQQAQRYLARQFVPSIAADEREPLGTCPVCGRQGRGRCPDCGQPFQKLQRAIVQRDGEEDAATAAANAVYDALDGWNDEAAAVAALQGHDGAMRRRIQSAFEYEHGESLQSYLLDELDDDWLVRATALLTSTNFHEPHTSLALALIPSGTRDAELFRILEGASLAGRQEIERRYNEAFGAIGEGSLRADLKDDLSGADLQKALVLLSRDLTEADRLYFDSLAISGTRDDAVIRRIQQVWQRGPAAFAELERQWNEGVKDQYNGADDQWTTLSLREAMSEELSGEEWELVRAVLDSYEAYQEGQRSGELPSGDGPATEEQRTRLEDIQLQWANDTLAAATTGGFTGAGTNEEQVYQAISTIRAIWLQRIERAEQAGDAARASEFRQQWEAERQRLAAIINAEMDEGGDENLRARLLTLGELTPADEVYLAQRAHDSDRVISLVTSFWASGRIAELHRLAGAERRDDAGTLLRPAFQLIFAVPITSGLPWQRLYSLINEEASDAQRGARRLALELGQGDSDSDLRAGYDLLTTPGISAELRNAVIELYVAQHCPAAPGETATRKFLNHINATYERSATCYDFLDLLEPSTDTHELVTRAEGRLEASQSGLFHFVVADIREDYDRLTGEDTLEVTEESLERLRFIAEHADATPAELEGLMAMMGAGSLAELAQHEYSAFQARLEELRQLERTIADALATVIELSIETALTIATGGATGGALLASISAAVAGMLVRELTLGQNYNLISKENAQQLALIVAGHGFGSFGRGIVADAVNPERLKDLSRARAFVQGMLSDAVTQVSVQTVAASFDSRLPSAEDIGAHVLTILGSSVASGKSAAISFNLSEHLPTIVRLRTQIAANITQNLVSGLTEEAATLVRNGTGDLTGAEIAIRFGRRSANSIGRGLVDSFRDISAEEVAAERQRRAEERALGGDKDLADLAHGPGVAEGTIHDPTAAAEAGVLSVSRANDEHNLSAVRTPDGQVVITICSPTCSRLHVLLEQARARITSEEALEFYAAQARDIERRLTEDPNDHDAQMDLEELAESVGAMINRAGERAVFGGAPSSAQPAPTPEQIRTVIAEHEELQRLYEQYVERKRNKTPGEQPLSPEEWAMRTSGRALALLNEALGGAGWRSAVRAAAPPPDRSEIFVEVSRELLDGLDPYPHQEYVGPFPLADSEILRLGPAGERAASGKELWLSFLEQGLDTLPAHVAHEFEQAVQRSRALNQAIELDKARGLYWPTDDLGQPWQLHHIVPREWGGSDNAPSNWIPVPYAVHVELHDWWRQLERRVRADQRRAMREGEQGEYIPEVE